MLNAFVRAQTHTDVSIDELSDAFVCVHELVHSVLPVNICVISFCAEGIMTGKKHTIRTCDPALGIMPQTDKKMTFPTYR